MPKRSETAPYASLPSQDERRPSTTILRPIRSSLNRMPQFRGRRQVAQTMWALADLGVMAVAAWLASTLLGRPLDSSDWGALTVAGCVRLAAFVRLGMYRAALRYSGIHVLAITVSGVLLGTAAGMAAGWFSGNHGILDLGRAFVTLEALLVMAGCGGLRFAARLILEPRWSEGSEPVLIYGAGDLGEATQRTLGRAGRWRPVGFIDDDPHKHGMAIHGRRVLGGLGDLPRIVAEVQPAVIFVAITDLPDATARSIAKACQAVGTHVSLCAASTSSTVAACACAT